MAELQPSKLLTWVRFPSPAPLEINVEIVDVFILLKISYKKFKYHNDRNNKNLITDKEQLINQK